MPKSNYFFYQEFIMSDTDFNLSWTRWGDRYAGKLYNLDYDDFPALDKFLLANASTAGCTSFTMADGFITAFLVGPYTQLGKKHQGLEIVWGESATAMSGKKDWPKDKRKMVKVLDGMAAEAWGTLNDDRHNYEPLLAKACKDEALRGALPSVIQWCRGFVKAFNHFPAAWADIFENPAGREVLGAILFFGGTKGWTPERENNDHRLKDYRKAFEYHIPYYVFTVKDFFQTATGLEVVREMNHQVADFWTPPTAYTDAV